MKRVVVLLSGGVDSSVSAALLKEQGFDVHGVYILGWTGTEAFPCSWQQEEADARAVAAELDIPFQTLNLAKEYERGVIDQFFAGYRHGVTPNPDILCNKEIKFKAVWRSVRQLEPDYIATGHYAQIRHGQIFKGTDPSKDQSYFLWAIDRSMLERILFPIGGLNKSEVRELAKKYGLITATKKDSQGICFIGPLKVRQFLQNELKPRSGKAVLKDGRVVGAHRGVELYTIGQRLGAGSVDWTGDVPPLFVVAKDLNGNRLIVGTDTETYASELVASDPNWLATISLPRRCQVKTRYRQTDVEAEIVEAGTELRVRLAEPVRALTPGQSLVIYDGAQLLGGALIKSVPAQDLLVEMKYGSKKAQPCAGQKYST